MSCAISSGRVAAMPNTDRPRNVPYGRSAFLVSATNSTIAFSGVPRIPGKTIEEIGPSGRRT
jgi:hypothetical protein